MMGVDRDDKKPSHDVIAYLRLTASLLGVILNTPVAIEEEPTPVS